MQHHRWREEDLLDIMYTALSRETTPVQLFHVLPCCFFPLLPSLSLSHFHYSQRSCYCLFWGSPLCPGSPHTLPAKILYPRHATHASPRVTGLTGLGWGPRRKRWEEAGRWVCHDRMGSETLVKTLREFRLSEGSWTIDVHTDRVSD